MEITDKKLKQILKEQSQDFKRHVSTLAEDFHSQVKLIGVQYSSIKETLDSHTEMIVSLKEDMDIVKTDIEFVMNSLKTKVDIDEFSAMEKGVTILESKVRTR